MYDEQVRYQTTSISKNHTKDSDEETFCPYHLIQVSELVSCDVSFSMHECHGELHWWASVHGEIWQSKQQREQDTKPPNLLGYDTTVALLLFIAKTEAEELLSCLNCWCEDWPLSQSMSLSLNLNRLNASSWQRMMMMMKVKSSRSGSHYPICPSCHPCTPVNSIEQVELLVANDYCNLSSH